jgi:hypothetical protein
MKNLIFSLLFIMSATTILTSCNGSVEDYPNDVNLSELVTKGNWKIDLFVGGNQNQTNDFVNYNFTFSKNGIVTATNNGVTENGTWNTNGFTNRLFIQFNNVNSVLNKISDDWMVNSQEEKAVSCSNDLQSNPNILKIAKQ